MIGGPSRLSTTYWKEAFWDSVAAAKSFALNTAAKLTLRKGTPQRELADHKINYILGDLATAAFDSEDGTAKVDLPLKNWPLLNKLLGSPITTIMVVTDLDLVKEIAKYGEYRGNYPDEQVREFFKFFISLTGGVPLLVNRNDDTVGQDKSKLRTTLNQKEIVNPAIITSINDWLMEAKTKPGIDLTSTFESAMFKFICRALFGIENFPPEKDFARLVKVMSEVDELIVVDSQSHRLQQLNREVQRFSQWLFDHNKESILKSKNILTDLVKEQDIPHFNIALLTIATSNITKLNALALTFLAENPQWQNRVRKALLSDKEEDQKFLNRFYLECCRLLMVTGNTARFVSKDCTVTAKDGEKAVKIEKGTLVITPHRRIQLHPDNYENPLVFNPDRAEFMDEQNPIRTGHPKLAPFGAQSARTCVASGSFTQNTFYAILRLVLTSHTIEKARGSHATFKIAPPECPYARLDQHYPVKISKIGLSQDVDTNDNLDSIEKSFGSKFKSVTPRHLDLRNQHGTGSSKGSQASKSYDMEDPNEEEKLPIQSVTERSSSQRRTQYS